MLIDLSLLIDVERSRLEAPPTEEEFFRAVDQLPELPDSDDALWDGEESWRALAGLIAAADLVGERGWRAPIPAIFERAALGDVDGYMQSIRHGPERAFRDATRDFARVLLPLASHRRPGTRQWVVRELGILRELDGLPALVIAAADKVSGVRDEAIMSIEMLAQTHPEAENALTALA